MFSRYKKIIPWALILVALSTTWHFGQRLHENYQQKSQIEQLISRLEIASQQQNQAMQAPPLSPRDSKSDLPNKSAAPNAISDPYTVEIEAQGIKLKMINEATWSMIFKLCFLWAFVLASLAMYRRYTR